MTLACIVCDKVLESAMPDQVNQPYKGLAFRAHGHYGCTVFDPMDWSTLEVNVCDECLVKKSRENKVLRVSPPPYQNAVVYWEFNTGEEE